MDVLTLMKNHVYLLSELYRSRDGQCSSMLCMIALCTIRKSNMAGLALTNPPSFIYRSNYPELPGSLQLYAKAVAYPK